MKGRRLLPWVGAKHTTLSLEVKAFFKRVEGKERLKRSRSLHRHQPLMGLTHALCRGVKRLVYHYQGCVQSDEGNEESLFHLASLKTLYPP